MAGSDFRGRTVACRQHITSDTVCVVAPFVEAGARVRLATCNPDSTDMGGDLIALKELIHNRHHVGVETIMLRGVDAIVSGQTADLPHGVQRYPRRLEARVAQALATGSA